MTQCPLALPDDAARRPLQRADDAPRAPQGPSSPRPHDGPGSRDAAAGNWPPVAVMMLVHMPPGARLWGWSRVVRGASALRGTPGLRFVRALGSGYEGGFGVKPSWDRQGLFTLFDTEDEALRFAFDSPAAAAYRAHADEMFTAVMRATSARGSWGGMQMAVTAQPDPTGPVVALTRASIRPRCAREFWSHTPASQASLEAADGCRLAAGLGEAPYLRQCTFSIWDSVAAMNAYARSGAHDEAIRHSMQGGWFSEWMFLRLQPLRMQGRWKGRSHG